MTRLVGVMMVFLISRVDAMLRLLILIKKYNRKSMILFVMGQLSKMQAFIHILDRLTLTMYQLHQTLVQHSH